MKTLLSRFALAVSMVGALSLGAMAQGPGAPGGARGQGGPGGGRMGMMGMGGGMMMGGGVTGLLRMKEVREELKLDEDQVAELEELGKAAMESMRSLMPQRGGPGGAAGGGGQPTPPNPQDMQAMMEKMQKATEENEAKVEEILDPKQLDRLVGLMIQRSNLQSLSSKLVATRLGITEEQKTKMAEVNKANGEKMRELFQGGGFNQENREKMAETMTKMREEGEAKIKEILTAKQKEDMESLKGPEFKFPQPQWGNFGGGQGGPGGPGGGRGNRRPGGGNDN